MRVDSAEDRRSLGDVGERRVVELGEVETRRGLTAQPSRRPIAWTVTGSSPGTTYTSFPRSRISEP